LAFGLQETVLIMVVKIALFERRFAPSEKKIKPDDANEPYEYGTTLDGVPLQAMSFTSVVMDSAKWQLNGSEKHVLPCSWKVPMARYTCSAWLLS
jgi:hypothetical protein